MIRITRSQPTAETLQDIYKTIHKIFTDSKYYYDSSEIEKIKDNPENLILTKDKE